MSNYLISLESNTFTGIEESRAIEIKKTFDPMAELVAKFELSYNEIVKQTENGITDELIKKARRLRIDIGKVRIETGKIKDQQKEYIKLEDKAIMGVHNILVWAIKEKEDKLKDIEKHYENIEKQRLEDLQNKRAEKLLKYVDDSFSMRLSDMDEEVWQAFFDKKKKDYEDKIEAEKKAEQERIEREKKEKEERERIRKENERLKKEKEDRDRAEKKRKEKEEAERKERERIEAEKQRQYEEKLNKEREEKERIQREFREKQEAEKKERERIEAEKQKKLNMDDAEKVEELILNLEEIKNKFSFDGDKNKKMFSSVCDQIDIVIKNIKG